ncbi:DUF427 domain-containing protein [Proteiniclasticum sp. BAD-10]|uniref:DUF427 domain-containing protein n=1 Tax=Proteiniclasticum sediminis TaxID=2804028 RepID=A0A941CNP2_9CLOT|nr:DUF427 domain-containing protein [Proteiniclasticum sediminis]MBR0576061.1 DUF427 domain-containing protein [Proteiniclasticum sediminis]
MVRALWNGVEIARSENTIVVEGNHYFPDADVDHAFLLPSDHHTRCPWKGLASYYTLDVNEVLNEDAAWYYPEPSEEAMMIKDHIAFWKGVEIHED